MSRMIEVPEQSIREVQRWWETADGYEGSLPTPPKDAINTIIACLPKPIKLGSRVRKTKDPDYTYEVIGLDDDAAWLRDRHGGHYCVYVTLLEVVG